MQPASDTLIYRQHKHVHTHTPKSSPLSSASTLHTRWLYPATCLASCYDWWTHQTSIKYLYGLCSVFKPYMAYATENTMQELIMNVLVSYALNIYS